LWGARLRPGDRIEKMVRETEALLATYLDGAGICAWQENQAGDAYEPVALPARTHVETLDVALWRIESEISAAIARGALKEKIQPAAPIDAGKLMND
jgi:hypothetical protein